MLAICLAKSFIVNIVYTINILYQIDQVENTSYSMKLLHISSYHAEHANTQFISIVHYQIASIMLNCVRMHT